jgi:dipeptidyl aminopeptidase/acylaminoacyl peptidase
LLELHGHADQVVPIAEGRALVDRAKVLGGFAEQVVHPSADHGFDCVPDSYAGDDAIARTVAFLRHQLEAD